MKAALLAQLQTVLEAELSTLLQAVDSAHAAATHEQAKPENKYDTRGLEASYLAGAQRERVKELQGALARLANHPVRTFDDGDAIAPSAVVELEQDGERSCCLVTLVGPGYRLTADDQVVMTLTTQSPLGRALLGKRAGDVVTVRVADVEKDYEVIAVR